MVVGLGPGYARCFVNKGSLELLEPAPAPIPGQLQRALTAPPRLAPVPVTIISLYYDDPDFEKDEENDDDDDEGGDPPPPAPAELERLKTGGRVYDEPPEDWQWDGRALAAGASPGVTMVPTAPMVPADAAPVAVHAHPVQAMANLMNPMPALTTNPTGRAEQQGAPQDAPTPPGGDGGGASGLPAGGPPKPQTLQRSTSVSARATRIEWTVDARKLRSSDQQAVSPSFDLTCGGRTVPFKMTIYPTKVPDQRGGASFKKSNGRGSVSIRCEADLITGSTPLRFRIYTGRAGVNKQTPRGPVEHDFSAGAVCGLPRDIAEWDFQEVQDNASSTFVVGLEVLTQ